MPKQLTCEAVRIEGEQSRDAPGRPPDLSVPQVVRAACDFVAARGRPAVFYLLGEGDDAEHRPDVPITRRTVEQLASALDDEEFPSVDLVIQSSGGDIHAAYQAITLLRRHMAPNGRITACVPRRAASAAMLLTLGADEVLLGETGTLSPLDAQIKIGVTSAGTPNYTSALHLLKGLDRLREFSIETFTTFAGHLYAENPERSERALLDCSVEFSRAITGPLLERIDSPNVGFWDQMLHTGEVYATELLTQSGLIDEPDLEKKERKAAEVVHELVNGYPSHTMIVGTEQLRKLGLRADHMDKHVRSVARRFASCSSETLIMVAYPPGSVPKERFGSPVDTTAKDWVAIGVDSQARSLTFRHGDAEFLVRVGLYRPKIATANPWWPGTGHKADGPSSAWMGLPGAPTGGPPPWPTREPDEEG